VVESLSVRFAASGPSASRHFEKNKIYVARLIGRWKWWIRDSAAWWMPLYLDCFRIVISKFFTIDLYIAQTIPE